MEEGYVNNIHTSTSNHSNENFEANKVVKVRKGNAEGKEEGKTNKYGEITKRRTRGWRRERRRKRVRRRKCSQWPGPQCEFKETKVKIFDCLNFKRR